MEAIEKAAAWLASGESEKGLAILQRLIDDTDDSVVFAAASVYQDYGFIEQAEQAYRRLLADYPQDSTILLQLADLLIDKNEEDQAIEFVQRIAADDDNYLSAQVLLAELYQMDGLTEVAEQKLTHALSLSPDNPILQAALGEFYLSVGQPLHAIDYLQSVYKNKMLTDQNIALQLAEAYSLSGQFEKSLPMYREGLKNGKTLDGLFGYAVVAARLDKQSIVIRTLEELRALDPSYTTLYSPLAEAYKHEGQLEKALETIEAGLEQDVYNERLYQEAAQLSIASHQNEKAAYYFQKCLTLDPDNTNALIKLIELYAQGGDDEAIISQLADKKIDEPMLQWFLASAYNNQDQLKEAGHYYQLCAAAFAANAEFLREYGDFERSLGHTADALKLYQQALRQNPENDELAEFIERLKQDDFS
ncbi:MAG: tetratricopeptide repeat protein [Sporolactobacillus sp.]